MKWITVLSFFMVVCAFSTFANPPTNIEADKAYSKQEAENVLQSPSTIEFEIEVVLDEFPIVWADVRRQEQNESVKQPVAILLTARQLGLGNKKCPVPVGWLEV